MTDIGDSDNPVFPEASQAAREKGRGYALLSGMSRLISSVPRTDVLLELLYEEIRKLFPADTYFVTLYDDASGEVSVEILIDDDQRFPRTRYRLKEGLAKWVIDNQRPLLIRDLKRDTPPVPPVRMGTAKVSRSWLGVPMLLGGKAVGVLAVASYRPDVYDEEDEDALLHVASQAAVAIAHARLCEEAQCRVRELDALQAVSLELLSSLSLSNVLDLVVHTALELTQATDVHIFLYDKQSDCLEFGASLWATGETGLLPETTPGPGGITMTAIRTGEPVVIDDCESHPLFADPERRVWGLKAIASLPLTRAEDVLGALNVAFLEPHAFGEEELRLLNLLANQAAIAIVNARLFREAQERAERLALVEDIAKAITSTFDLGIITSAVSRSLESLVPHDHMTLLLCDAEGTTLRVVGTIGLDAPALSKGMSIRLDGGVLKQTMESRLPATVSAEECEDGSLERALFGNGLRSLVVVPILADGNCRGVWTLASRREASFNSSKVELLGQISSHLAIAIGNAGLYSNLAEAFDELRKSQSRLAHAERIRALAELSAGVAHDFNNVLTSILGRVQLLLLDVEDPGVRESLEVIEQAARNGAQMVRRIMGFARRREREPFSVEDVNRIVEDAILLTEPRWRNPSLEGASISLEFTKGHVEPVFCSAAEIGEVLTNLIFNAVDAMPRGGKITIETRKDNDRTVVEVRDTGVGMPEAVMERVFTPFFTTKGAAGAGMGLSVAREIVTRHGGDIQVESRLGEGSSFTVRLPIAREAQVRRSKEELRMEEAYQRGKSISILVIEDEESIRRLLASILGMEGHEVRSSSNAADGLAHFRERAADLVITDLGLPDQSGWEVARQVKTMSPSTPVILITGWGVSAEVTEARRRGVDYVLPKPFEFEDLSELISRALSNLEE